MTNIEVLQAYKKTRADRLGQVRTKLAVLDSIITEIEQEAHQVYNTAMAALMNENEGELWFAETDTEYANMAADLRSSREALRVLLAHLTSALVRTPTINLFTTGDHPDES